jgi:hypothetical protein
MNENPEIPGYYWVKEDLGEGATSPAWEPAAWDGKNWWAVDWAAHGMLLYVAVVGERITVPGETP